MVIKQFILILGTEEIILTTNQYTFILWTEKIILTT